MNNYDFVKAGEYFQDKMAFTTGVHELEILINGATDKTNIHIVDVRYPADYAASHVPGAVNLPKGKWQNPRGLERSATLFLYCYSPTCHLAAEAAVQLVSQGYRVTEVEGGWESWVNNGYRVEIAAKSA